MSTPAVDPWLDPFTPLGREGYFRDITQVATEEGFGVPDTPADVLPPIPLEEIAPPVAPVEPVAPPESEEQPIVFPIEGGGTATMEKTSKGWTGTLDTGIPDAKLEVFYGKTKNELFGNLMKAKLNSTKKIREQEYKLKLGDPAQPVAPPTPPSVQNVAVRDMTADERFEYRNLLESDPVRAHDYYNEKRFGLNPEQFAQRLNKVATIEQQARANEADSVAWRFVEQNQDYYRDDAGENYLRMVRYLGRNIGRTVTKTNIPQTVEALYDAGFWTLEHLEAAKEDLMESGLLLRKPVAPTQAVPPPVAVTPQEVPPPPAQPPVPQTPIAPVERPRAANLGLRVAGASAPAVVPTPAFSVEDPASLSDDQIQAAMKSYRRGQR